MKLTGNAKAYAKVHDEREERRANVAPPKKESVTRIRVSRGMVHAVNPGNKQPVCGWRFQRAAASTAHPECEEVAGRTGENCQGQRSCCEVSYYGAGPFHEKD